MIADVQSLIHKRFHLFKDLSQIISLLPFLSACHEYDAVSFVLLKLIANCLDNRVKRLDAGQWIEQWEAPLQLNHC